MVFEEDNIILEVMVVVSDLIILKSELKILEIEVIIDDEIFIEDNCCI